MIGNIDSENNLDGEPESQVYKKMSRFQDLKGVAHIITEIMEEGEELYTQGDDKHKYMKEVVGRKFSTLNSPTESVHSSQSSKPFHSPKNFKKDSLYFQPREMELVKDREYDYVEILKFEGSPNEQHEQELRQSAKKIISLLKKRDEYQQLQRGDWVHLDEILEYHAEYKIPIIDWSQKIPAEGILKDCETVLVNGVYSVQQGGQWITRLHSIVNFVQDLLLMVQLTSDKMITSFCYARNKFLEQKFKMHQIFNADREAVDQKKIKQRDFYNIMKIDTHIHHSQGMCARKLLEFMKKKFRNCPHVVVYYDEVTKKQLTLKDISNRFRIKPDELNLDILDVQADKSLYKRFDRFTSKYSPLGQPMLRNIFLKSDNYIQGRYIAELTLEMMQDMDTTPFIGAEYRITIYGKSMDEWHKKSRWIVSNNLYHPQVRWMIQIPRLYSVYFEQKAITCFQDMIDNIFKPLFDITINPTLDPDLYQALFTINGFDCVDDETKHENFFLQHLKIQPKEWTRNTNPHYAYWIYYIYANLCSLNTLRKLRGLNTFELRPHCGEAGNIDHLACSYLLAQGISHGLVLEESPVLKYLFYLKQIGVSMSPIANNKLICRYAESPFYSYFRQGLNVCLSTDDPLMLHITDQPLLEEFAIAAQVFDLSNVDLAELARNSVRCSSFETVIKEFYVGTNHDKPWETINNPNNNNVPQSRFLFRQETLREEFHYLREFNKKQ